MMWWVTLQFGDSYHSPVILLGKLRVCIGGTQTRKPGCAGYYCSVYE